MCRKTHLGSTGDKMILTTTEGQSNLPRYFSAVWDKVSKLRKGRLDIIMPDGRIFRAEGKEPGKVAEVTIHNPEVFARTIREGDLGFCEAYMEGWWDTPDLLTFMDMVHDDAEDMYDGFAGQKLVVFFERLRFGGSLIRNVRPARTSAITMILGTTFTGSGLTTR